MPERARARKVRVSCSINGKPVAFETLPMSRFLDVLREELRLTGTKEGCGEGECGACAIEMNGELVNSCLLPALQTEGASIRTIEGVAYDSKLDAIQQSFLDHGGAQCGICTPGMVLAAENLLDRHPQPSEAQAREALAGNLCRCTGYIKIFESVLGIRRKTGPTR